jgi:hypothetical protein
MHLARVRLTLDLRGADSEEAAARRVGERAARVPRAFRPGPRSIGSRGIIRSRSCASTGMRPG